MRDHSLATALQHAAGFAPGAVAVMGKWEPFLPAARCLEEVAARAAAALALSEALEPAGPGLYLLSAEAQLRWQPRPGCVLAAEILVELGARPERIRCCAAANRTVVELGALDRMRHALGVAGLLLLTADYHLERARRHLARLALPAMHVLGCDDPFVRRALAALPAPRRAPLERALARGQRNGQPWSASRLNESVARAGERWSLAERLVADVVRGRGDADAPMFEPRWLDGVPRR